GIGSVSLDDATWIPDDAVGPTIELDESLARLAALDERRSRILEQRYFGGLSLEETAEELNVSLATVKRELRAARAWLAVELERDVSGAPPASPARRRRLRGLVRPPARGCCATRWSCGSET